MRKQETLEEAIKREYETRKFNSDFPFDSQSFKLGAKWQQEQQDCCTPAGQIKRYVDCVGCDKKLKEMSKQTAVEFFVEQLIIDELIDVIDSHQFLHLQSIAKEMEKEQHKDTWFDSTAQFDNAAEMTYKKDFEQYYNETYKNKNNV